MKAVTKFFIFAAAAALAVLPRQAPAAEFSFTFDWGKIPVCNDGYTFDVPSPIFTFANVPAGTKTINMYMEDVSIGYDHEGGTINYAGQNVIQRGAFDYKVPCPPDGTHTYEWTARAKNANSDEVGKAKSEQDYPK